MDLRELGRERPVDTHSERAACRREDRRLGGRDRRHQDGQ